MTFRLIIEILAVAGLATFGLLLTFANYRLVNKVNAHSPQELDSPHPGGDFLKLLHLHREYQRLFPEGNLHIRIRVMMALMFACLLVAAFAVRVL